MIDVLIFSLVYAILGVITVKIAKRIAPSWFPDDPVSLGGNVIFWPVIFVLGLMIGILWILGRIAK